MNSNSTSAIKRLLLVFLVIAGLYFGREFFIPFTLGALLAMLFLPLCKWLEARKVPRAIAAFLCLLVLMCLFAVIIGLLSWQFTELANDAVKLQVKFYDIFSRLQEYIHSHLGISEERQFQLLQEQQSSLTAGMMSIAAAFPAILVDILLMFAYIVLLLFYRNHIKRFFLMLADPEQKEEMEQVIFNATHISQQYLLGLSKMIACLWVMYSIGFGLIGVNNPVFFAIICGLMEIVPFIGNLTGTTITVLVAVVHGADTGIVIGIIITYCIVQFIQGWILEPLIVGPQVKINPLFTILALIIGELIWGIPGIILAIPITGMFKIVCDHVKSLKAYGFLIGETEATSSEGVSKKIKNLFSGLENKKR